MTHYRSKGKGHKDSSSGLELSIGQVLAATGATVIGAILVKLLDIWGTILGTAVLSICTSIGAVLILRALRRTGDKIKEQIAALAPNSPIAGGVQRQARTVQLDPDHVAATAKIPSIAELEALREETVEISVDAAVPEAERHLARSQSRKRTMIAMLVSSVLVFGLTIGSLYLLGSLTGDPGRFVNQPDTQVMDTDESPSGETTNVNEQVSEEASETPSEDASRTPSETPSETPSSESTTDAPTDAPTSDGGSGGAEVSPSPEAEEPVTATEEATG